LAAASALGATDGAAATSVLEGAIVGAAETTGEGVLAGGADDGAAMTSAEAALGAEAPLCQRQTP
jgi:hypothetical protein